MNISPFVLDEFGGGLDVLELNFGDVFWEFDNDFEDMVRVGDDLMSVHLADVFDNGFGEVNDGLVLGLVRGLVFGDVVLELVFGDVVLGLVFGDVVLELVLDVGDGGLGVKVGNSDASGDDLGLGLELGLGLSVDVDVVVPTRGEDVRTGLRNEIPSCLNHGISKSTGIQCCCPSHKSALIAYRCISSSTTTSPW
jgi:hypothetical protein